MKLIKVAACTLNQTPLDWDDNQRHLIEALQRARQAGASVLCLPELCITGYGCEDAFLAPGTHATALEVLLDLLEHTRGMIVSFGLPIRHTKANYNACCLVSDGRICGFVAKRALAGDGIHYEPRWFKPWPLGRRSHLTVAGSDYPLGDLHFEVGGIKIGFEICEDAWVAKRPGIELALEAVDIILNPSASHFAFGKHAIRDRLVLEGSRAFGVSYVYANMLGNEAGRAIYDGDAMIASQGRLVARAHRFGFSDLELITAVIDVDQTRSHHSGLSGYRPELSEETACIRCAFSFPEALPEPPAAFGTNSWELGEDLKEQEFTRATALSLFDYLRKSRSRGFVVSLSGGADSSAVACLVRLMVALAVKELGLTGFVEKLAHIPALSEASSETELVRRLLTTVYQSTANSSETTRRAARQLAEALGAEHLEFDVEPMVKTYVATIEQALGRKLDWEHDDIALQNIQARVRAPSVWLIANLKGALLLSTSNRSEAAVGYATMDGDTSGGLSPIAGIDKAYLRRWLGWLEHKGLDELGPISALAEVNALPPTAELRPSERRQTDEEDLMPYDLLDAIERAAIRDKRGPLDVFMFLRQEFTQYSATNLATFIERFFRLWSRNQWKRERYAPSFHVDDANLDPKTWCRFPILSGGFERELTELRRFVAKLDP
jgi:NAD+ synthase (glutamine-hydrolysing)